MLIDYSQKRVAEETASLALYRKYNIDFFRYIVASISNFDTIFDKKIIFLYFRYVQNFQFDMHVFSRQSIWAVKCDSGYGRRTPMGFKRFILLICFLKKGSLWLESWGFVFKSRKLNSMCSIKSIFKYTCLSAAVCE